MNAADSSLPWGDTALPISRRFLSREPACISIKTC